MTEVAREKTELPLPKGVRLITASNPGALANCLAARVGQWLTAALAKRPRASLAVSGGRSPVAFFEALSGRDLDWGRIDLTLVDERWVPPEHADSNERLVRRHLLKGQAADLRFLPLKVEAALPGMAQDACEERLAAIDWPLDVVVLGMGNDGHTASLFPGMDNLTAALAPSGGPRCMAVTPPGASHARMTLCFGALDSARHRALYLLGEDKRRTLRRVLERPEAIGEMPVRAFLRPGLEIFWSP